MVNLGNPELAFETSFIPNDGVGLARMEFIITEHIKAHPMALVHPDRVTDAQERQALDTLTAGYPRPADFFVEKLAEGVGTIAAAFYPKPVIVRMSDFKTNEYASLLGGRSSSRPSQTPCWGSAAPRAMRIPPTPRASPWSAPPCAGCASTWG